MILPIPKYFRILKGVTFDYPFQYLVGSSTTSSPVNLTGYTGIWTITYTGGSTVYNSSASPGQSGVFFGGQSNQPTNGMINLIINRTDTAVIPWKTATYTFQLIDTLNNEYQLLNGGIGVI
jgi:hypothetical protein